MYEMLFKKNLLIFLFMYMKENIKDFQNLIEVYKLDLNKPIYRVMFSIPFQTCFQTNIE